MNYRTIPTYTKDNHINAVVEISKGTYDKYEIDQHTGDKLICVRTLHKGIVHDCKYPFNYGFIPSTLADDNDELDAVILTDKVLQPLTIVECEVVAVIPTVDIGEQDDKIILVPVDDPLLSDKALLESTIKSAAKYLSRYKYPYQKATVVYATQNKEQALNCIDKCKVDQPKSAVTNKVGKDPFGSTIDRVNF